jgi:hypothetical protein
MFLLIFQICANVIIIIIIIIRRRRRRRGRKAIPLQAWIGA